MWGRRFLALRRVALWLEFVVPSRLRLATYKHLSCARLHDHTSDKNHYDRPASKVATDSLNLSLAAPSPSLRRTQDLFE